MLLWALDYYEQTVDYLRHGDIKHGLVTMAAFLGLLPADQGQSPGDALRPLQAEQGPGPTVPLGETFHR